MADPKYRSASVFAGTKKVAEFHGWDYEIAAGDETVYADVDGGVAGYTDGAVEGTLTATGMMPVQGMQYNFETQLVAHNNIDVGLGTVNGKIHQMRAHVIRAKFTGEQKTGMLTGEFTMRLFKIKFTG